MKDPKSEPAPQDDYGGEAKWQGPGILADGCASCDAHQGPGSKRLQRCAGCKRVLYCKLCKLNAKMLQEISGSQPQAAGVAAEFDKWATLHRPIFVFAIYHALQLGKNPDAYKSHGLYVEFTAKPDRHKYPLHQRYNVGMGCIVSLDTLHQMVSETPHGEELATVYPRPEEDRQIGVILLTFNGMARWQRLGLMELEQLGAIARSIGIPKDWVSWLEKAINENLQAKIRLPRDFKGGQH
ncbi:hypothetical protein CONPUDRAFT_70457 [Coniophora puteana RWD-64-598 SS2]|uniref:Uncharacterized protein n=1 Tax=Coniophora puteana (strain RWD-64-598) TaxID=741705 RepID=A0A5M3N491_CONPW|nr:uncharacterized protein CONPUDRAFT_70457 [Coniophora puteana RWD-64-598 SS2]EIW85721.1 hypothetical protein CONPUDRAFT_70457 [Coniophora puteana RWD-64-598 SS2]